MYNTTQYMPSYSSQFMLAVLKKVLFILKFIPSGLATCLFGATKVVFISLLGFSAWVRHFSDGEFQLWFAAAICLCLCVHALSNSNCKIMEEKTRKIKSECETKCLEHEVTSQRSICDALEYVRAALASKSVLEHETGKSNEKLKAQIMEFQRHNTELKKKLLTVQDAKENLERDLQLKSQKITRATNDFREQLNEIEDSMHEIQSEKTKSAEENRLLRRSLQIVEKQNEEILAKYQAAVKHSENLREENAQLVADLSTRDQDRATDLERISQLQTLTQRLQRSLSSAKGKLTKVGGMLSADNQVYPNISVQ
uniref:Uncharacterized protein n=1 Tax=Ciona savignyi TaxID=51511 RepID=H2ZH39_CIOSA